MIYVCSLARLYDTVATTGATHVVTLLMDPVERPKGIEPANHLVLSMDDILEPLEGDVLPAEEHAAQLIDFARGWGRKAPLVMHCWAGISRSTAGAFIAACALNPERSEAGIAEMIRRSSATAIPNLRLVSHADRLLRRQGRMTSAIEALGAPHPATEGHPFQLDLE
jgi:predicted protein tyrosine phosphatase